MKESTVKSRLQRGRKQIAELYEYKVRRDVPNDES